MFSGYYRILCITAEPAAFNGAVAFTWGRFAHVRWTFIKHDDNNIHKEIRKHVLVLLDCTTEQVRAASLIYRRIPPNKLHAVAFDGTTRAAWGGSYTLLGNAKLLNLLESLPLPVDFPPVAWPEGDPDIELTKPVLGATLPFTVQKYFPSREETAHVRKVVGGWSGTPLLRIMIEGKDEECFLKFFDDPAEFVREWDSHAQAVAWLQRYVVPLHAVPELALNGGAQVNAFPLASRGLYPICYQSARVTATLKELYKNRSDAFIEDAYREVLNVLKLKQPSTEAVHQPLSAVEDIGPGRNRRLVPRTMIEALRTPEYRSFMYSAKAELAPYLVRCIPEREWLPLQHAFDEFLRTD